MYYDIKPFRNIMININIQGIPVILVIKFRLCISLLFFTRIIDKIR